LPAFDLATWAKKSIAVTALIVSAALPLSAHAETPAVPCDTPIDLLRLANPLLHVAHKLATREPIVVVAIGSSSTAGAGASSPAANYPTRLEAELRAHFPNRSITVLNRGVNGEEVDDMLRRFDAGVIAAKPDLVLWQLGTNSVIRDHMSDDHGASIRSGLARLRAAGADVVLIDPQFAPKVIIKPEAERMVELISATAKLEDVDLFRRFDVMKRWHKVDNLAFETFVSPDGLHMNDWSYACMAKGLGQAIAEAAQRPVVSATVGSHLVP
jgi:lysophospholipase L1-like esterase